MSPLPFYHSLRPLPLPLMERSDTPTHNFLDGKWRDLLWYTSAASAAVGLTSTATQAQVVIVDLGETFVEDRSLLVDLDGDGDPEFDLNEDDLDNSGNPRDYLRFYQAPENAELGDGPDTVTGLVGQIFPFSGQNYNYPLPLDVGVTIGPDQSFQDYYLNTFTFTGDDPVGWKGAGPKYVGMRLSLTDAGGAATTHYGWVLIDVPQQGGALVAIAAAYNATPDAPITTGDATAGESGPLAAATHRISAPAPNPASSGSTFDLTVAKSQTATAELYNLIGQRVATLFAGALAAETPQTIAVDGSTLPAGVYVVRVTGETFAGSVRLTLTK